MKKARLTAGISLADMSKLLGIHRTPLTDYEFNRVFIPNEILARVEEICQVPQYSLFDEYHLFIENCGQIILDYCEREKISLCAFAKRINICRQSVYAWVKKKLNPAYKSWIQVKSVIEGL